MNPDLLTLLKLQTTIHFLLTLRGLNDDAAAEVSEEVMHLLMSGGVVTENFTRGLDTFQVVSRD